MTPSTIDVAGLASLARHLAFSPVAFAVTEGPMHAVRYANAAFQGLVTDGKITIGGAPDHGRPPITDLTPLLDRAFRGPSTLHDVMAAPQDGAVAKWSCTVWPIAPAPPALEGLVIEVRDAAYVAGVHTRQRAITEQLLLAALREQDSAGHAIEMRDRATFLAAASRELAQSLDQDTTRDTVRRRVLPRVGTWCIVDVIESSGAIHRLAVVHPDPTKQALARTLADCWHPKLGDPVGAPDPTGKRTPTLIKHDARAALLAVARGPENLAILQTLGFDALLVVPLVTRARVVGAITFVTPEGDSPLSPEEIALASDLADQCATALDNARLYRQGDALRADRKRPPPPASERLRLEMQTPLAPARGYAELMQTGFDESRAKARGEEPAEESSRHPILAEILKFVRTESGRMEYRFGEVPVQSVLHDVAEMLHGVSTARQLSVDGASHDTDDADAIVWADPDRVRQVLLNLALNAVKFTPVGGGTVTLTFDATLEAVAIHVTDLGPGIPFDKLEAIFEPFEQLTNVSTDRPSGVGLGLAISRDLARAMHGDVTVESSVGVGSRFTLTLPRARQAAA